jgi:hypothetical protein
MEPDLIFFDGSKVGIEVTTAYYHETRDNLNFQAREEWQFAAYSSRSRFLSDKDILDEKMVMKVFEWCGPTSFCDVV